MSNKANILVYEKMQSVQYRIEEIINSVNLSSASVNTKTEFMAEFKKMNYQIDLILLDISSNIDIEFVEKINQLNPDIPIIIVTDKQDKDFFIKLLKVGVQDFIIKPFNDDTFTKKILNYPYENYINDLTEITFEPMKYIKAEFRKAEKGKFSVSVILFTFIKTNESDEKRLIDIRDNIYAEFQSLFWDTDIFFKLDRKYFLGILPFCSEENIHLVENKMNQKLTELSRINLSMKSVILDSVYTIYPDNNLTSEKVLGELIAQLHKKHPNLNVQINLKL
jgi:CheY-like chemotaxis protein